MIIILDLLSNLTHIQASNSVNKDRSLSSLERKIPLALLTESYPCRVIVWYRSVVCVTPSIRRFLNKKYHEEYIASPTQPYFVEHLLL